MSQYIYPSNGWPTLSKATGSLIPRLASIVMVFHPVDLISYLGCCWDHHFYQLHLLWMYFGSPIFLGVELLKRPCWTCFCSMGCQQSQVWMKSGVFLSGDSVLFFLFSSFRECMLLPQPVMICNDLLTFWDIYVRDPAQWSFLISCPKTSLSSVCTNSHEIWSQHH